MRKILVICLALIVCFGVQAKDKAPEISDISLEGAGNGQNGTILLNVTVSAKKADKVTNDVLVRSAVRMALFRGWNDRNKSSYGTSGASHPPICGEADANLLTPTTSTIS